MAHAADSGRGAHTLTCTLQPQHPPCAHTRTHAHTHTRAHAHTHTHLHAKRARCVAHGVLQALHKRACPEAQRTQVQQRVRHQLSGAMVGRLAAALHLLHVDAQPLQLLCVVCCGRVWRGGHLVEAMLRRQRSPLHVRTPCSGRGCAACSEADMQGVGSAVAASQPATHAPRTCRLVRKSCCVPRLPTVNTGWCCRHNRAGAPPRSYTRSP
jgi:hypothetical protein